MAVLCIPVGLPGATAAAVGTAASASIPPPLAVFTASVLWNGVDAGRANSPSSAIAASIGDVVTVTFLWNWSGAGAAPYSISNLRLHVLFFSQSVYTKDQAFNPARAPTNGSFDLTSDLTASRYLLEGIFLISAEIVSDSSGTVWSEQFYVHVTAPYHLVAATLGLGALLVYELVQLVRVGPHALPKGRLKTQVVEESAPKGGA